MKDHLRLKQVSCSHEKPLERNNHKKYKTVSPYELPNLLNYPPPLKSFTKKITFFRFRFFGFTSYMYI